VANADESAQRVVTAPTLADLAATDHAWDLYAQLKSCKQQVTKTQKPYLTLTLADQSGAVEAKVWSDAKEAMATALQLEVGAFVKIRGRVEDYQGTLQVKVERMKAVDPQTDPDFDPARLVDPALARVEDLVCRTLVFDIETVPAQDYDDLPENITEALKKHAQRRDAAGSADELAARIGMSMGLSPLFGKVVSIAVGDGDSPDAEVCVLAVPKDGQTVEDPPSWLRLMTETELLASFWALASQAETVVSFNGRNFDVPFLLGRSLILDVPARCDLISNKWGLRPHLDLYEFLNQRDKGPASLDVVCWALGVESPKGDMDGSKVAPTYARGGIQKIAEYNRHDVRATGEVFRKVRDTILRFRTDWKGAR
jgi:predicted PolB exonuclease-like 3'-5' exonuclease